jgi:hypothetical protein
MINRHIFFSLEPHSYQRQQQSCYTTPTISPNFTVSVLSNCYLPSLFLNIQNICQSCLVTPDSFRNNQPLFPKDFFALLLLKLLFL